MKEYTRRVARQYSRRRLETMKKSLVAMMVYWGDQDQYIVDELERAHQVLEEIWVAMDESVQEGDEIEREI